MKSFDDYYWHQFDVLNKDTQLARQFGQDVWDYKQAEIDELQKRIDEITSHVDINFDEDRDDDQHSYWSGYNQAMRELNDIVKGNKND